MKSTFVSSGSYRPTSNWNAKTEAVNAATITTRNATTFKRFVTALLRSLSAPAA
jgi:hypothetical protein